MKAEVWGPDSNIFRLEEFGASQFGPESLNTEVESFSPHVLFDGLGKQWNHVTKLLILLESGKTPST